METKEQKEKIAKLREERETAIKAKHYTAQINKEWEKGKLKEGDAVTIFLNKSVSFPGFISKIKTDKAGVRTFTVDSVNGEIKDLTAYQLQKRIIEDLSDVIVPEEIKKMHTRQLLEELKSARRCSRPRYDVSVLKAELATREHIKSKYERKIFPKKSK